MRLVGLEDDFVLSGPALVMGIVRLKSILS